MKTSLAFTLMLQAIACMNVQVNHSCFYYMPDDFIAFNMKSLADVGVKTENFQLIINGVSIPGTITYDLCGELAMPDNCPEAGKMTHAYFKSTDESVCRNLIAASPIQNEYDFLDQSSTDSMAQGFSIHKLASDFILTFKCNPNFDSPKFTIGNNSYTVEAKDACGYLNEAARVFKGNKIIFSVVMIIFGIMLTFFGGYKWNYLVGLLGFAIGLAATYFIFWTIIVMKPETWSYILVGVLAVIVGLLGSWSFSVFSDLAYFAFGLIAGLTLSRNIFFLLQLHVNDVD